MPKKLKIKQNIKEKLKKLGAGFFLAVFLLCQMPRFALADNGETAYGKWYTADEIFLRTEVDVSDSLGNPQGKNFVRIGNEPNLSSFKVKFNVYLESPETLTFEGDNLWDSPIRDGVKAPDKYGVGEITFGENIFGLVGVGSAWGLKENIKCEKKNPDWVHIWRHQQEVLSCYNKLDESGSKLNKKETTSKTYKAGELLYTHEITVSQKEFAKLGLIGPQQGAVSRLHTFQVWPQLYVNVGDMTLTEGVIAGTTVTYLSSKLYTGIEATMKSVNGITAKAFEWVKKWKSGEATIGQAVEAVVKVMPDLPPAEARAIAEETVSFVAKISGEQRINVTVLENSLQPLVNRLLEKGLPKDKALAVASEHLNQIASQLGKDAPKLFGATGKILENVAAKTVTTEAEKKAAGFLGRQVAKVSARLASKSLIKFVPVVGWVWTAVDIILYISTFQKGEITYYNYQNIVGQTSQAPANNSVSTPAFLQVLKDNIVQSYSIQEALAADAGGATHDVFIEVFDTEASALAHIDEPPPEGVSIQTGSKSGSGVNPKGTGSSLLGFINSVIGIILGFLQELIFTVFYYLVAPLIQAVLSIHTYTDTFAAVIYPGWEVIRNLSNILFIVAIIAIAMGTLFRVESYQYKHLVVQLIIAALLVNFSLVIAQVILGVADTIQSQFLPNNADVIRALGRDLIVGYRSTVYNGLSFASGGFFSNTVTPFFFLALAMGSFVVFCAIAAFLVVRIVFLWVLLMLSPIAYLAGVLPSTEKYRGEWWGLFIKYAFFTPIMAFFLNMAAVITGSYKSNSILQQISYADFGNNGLSAFVFKVSSNILLLVFLFISIKVAEEFGIFGADIAAKALKGGIAAPFAGAGWLGKRGLGYLGRKYTDFTTGKWVAGEKDKKTWGRSLLFAALNPVATAQSWAKRSKELEEASHHKAEATGMMVVEQRLTHGHKVIPRVQQHAKSEADKFVKDFNSMSREKQVNVAQDIMQMGDSEEAKAMKRAITTSMMSRGFIDDAVQDGAKIMPDGSYSPILQKMLKNHHFQVKPPEFDALGNGIENEDWYIDEEDGKYKMRYTDHEMNAYFEALFGSHDQEALRMLAEEGEKYGKETFHPEYMRAGHFDMEKDSYRWSTDMVKEGKFAGDAFTASEWSKMGYRQQAQIVYMALRGRGGKMNDRTVKTATPSLEEGITYSQERNSKKMALGADRVVEGADGNFDASSGAIVVGPQTYLNWKDAVERLKTPGVMLSNYLRATGGKITGGRTTQEAIRGLAEDLKYIQASPGDNYAAAKAANGGKDRAITQEHWEAVRLNGGLQITVKSAKDVHKIVEVDATKRVAASALPDQTHVMDMLGATVGVPGMATAPAPGADYVPQMVPVSKIKF